MRRVVWYDARSRSAAAAARTIADRFDVRPWRPGDPPPRGPAVLLLDGARPRIARRRDVRAIGLVPARARGPWPPAWWGVVPRGASPAMLARSVTNALADAHAAVERARLERELSELNAIGIRLSAERDPAALLDTILKTARQITESDAGSLYLVEESGQARRLRFALAQNDSVPFDFASATLPLGGDSVAGHVALTGETVNVADAYAPPRGAPFRINRWFDDRAGYRTKSMLVVPMRTPQGETIGVLQLINCHPGFSGRLATPADVARHVRRFGARHETLAGSLASQAAVAVANSRLYEAIQRLFDGFVKASVTAIEARDPTTFGHSFRVADLSVALADVVDRCDTGLYRDARLGAESMRELRYAALLHDFGKVAVREHVLGKAKKLYPVDLERIRHRVELLQRDLQIDATRRKLDHVLASLGVGFAEVAARVDEELARTLAELDRQLELVVLANEPAVLPRDFATELLRLASRPWPGPGGVPRRVLTDEEASVLAIPRGSLTDGERREIEQHVLHTFDFLAEIPWTRELRRIPEIARAHHERLDGSGYPDGVLAERIPLESRVMAIADIYDALTATDRPYKKAVRTEEALEILDAERHAGALDGALLDLFIDARVWERAAAR